MREHDEDEWNDDEDDGLVEDEDEDEEEDEDAGVEDEIAAYAVSVWEEIEGDDELAEASREALVLIAQEALAKKEARLRREEAARQRRLARDRAEADERFAWQEAERRAQQAHQRAVEEAHSRVVPVVERRPRRVDLANPPRITAKRSEMSLRAEQSLPPIALIDDNDDLDDDSFEDGELEAMADDFQAAATAAARVALADAMPRPASPHPRPVEEPFRFPSDDDAPSLTGTDLAAWRARHGLTQQAAADRLGVRQGTVSKAESRNHAPLGPTLRDALAAALGEHASA